MTVARSRRCTFFAASVTLTLVVAGPLAGRIAAQSRHAPAAPSLDTSTPLIRPTTVYLYDGTALTRHEVAHKPLFAADETFWQPGRTSGVAAPLPSADTTPPTVSITAPAIGSTVSNVTTVSATGADNVGLVSVEFTLDGIHLATLGGGGTFTFTTLDGTPPSVSVTSPAAGVTLSGPAILTAQAADNVGVAGVQFTLDGTTLGAEVTAPPFSMSWNPQGSANLVFGAAKVGVGPMTINAGAGFTRRVGVSCPSCSGDDTISEDAIKPATGSTAATFTFSTAAHYLAQMAAFKGTGTPAHVQSAAATTNAGGSTLARAFPASPAAGNLIVVAVAWQGTAPLSLSDSQSNTYASATSTFDPVNGQTLAIAYAANAKSGATTVTATFGGAAPTVQRMTIHEYSGIATVNPLDVTATAIADGSTTPNAVSSGAATTTVAQPAAAGAHSITASASDAAGNTATSAAVSIAVGAGSDTTPPAIAITSPAPGVTVSGTATVGATASDNVGVAGVQFRLDAAPLGAEDTAAPFSVAWITTGASPGLHTLTAVARDAAGNTMTSTAVSVTVAAAADTTPPAIAITSPAPGVTVSGTATVTATASDNVGVAGVQFRLDGASLGAEDTAAPFSVAWNTTGALAGSHTLTAVARDAAGNLATSTAVAVTVANGTVRAALAWDPSVDPTIVGYKVYVGTASGVYSVPIDVSNVTTYAVTGLTPGTVYYFVVTGHDATGVESPYSNEVSGTGQ